MALQSNTGLHFLSGLLPFSSVFCSLFRICNFAFISFCFYTIPPSVPLSNSLRIIVKYLTYFSFTSHSINMANPIQLFYYDNWNYIWISQQLHYFPTISMFVFSFTLIPSDLLLEMCHPYLHTHIYVYRRKCTLYINNRFLPSSHYYFLCLGNYTKIDKNLI